MNYTKFFLQEQDKMIFRHEDEKMCLLQMGRKFNLPNEITVYIYRKKKAEDERYTDEIRNYNIHNILWMFDRLTWSGMWEKFSMKEIKEKKLEKIIKEKKLEIIAEVPRVKHLGNIWPFMYGIMKEATLNQIQIIGEPNYLMKKNEDKKRLERCPLQWKLEYLRKNFWNKQSEFDFNNFQEWKGTIHENSWRICIDSQGQPQFL